MTATIPACPTIKRLNTLKPGERVVYLSLVDGVNGGAACRELTGQILDHAAGLALAGRIDCRKERRLETSDDKKKRICVTDYVAIGRKHPW